MPLTFTSAGERMQIQKIKGKDETVRFLEGLGFICGEWVTVVSKNGGNLIVKIKDCRVAISNEMAAKIMVA